jgi:hypothetical protein
MVEPRTADEYQQRFQASHRITGYGAEVETHMPCPWCAAPDWQVLPIVDVAGALQREATCVECGRAGRMVFAVNEPGHQEAELVQTGGPDAPGWLTPAPRRAG